MKQILARAVRGVFAAVGIAALATCTIPIESVWDGLGGVGSIDSLFVIQAGETVFIPSDDWDTPVVVEPDMPFRVRWIISGDEGRLYVIVSHPMCNPGADPTEPLEVPDCPQLQLEVPRSCMTEGNAVVSGLPSGHPWARYDVVVRYKSISTGGSQAHPCEGVIPQDNPASGIVRLFWDLSSGNASPNGWESITVSEFVTGAEVLDR